MERVDFSQHRVLLVGPKSHALLLLRSVMTIAGVGKVTHVEEARRALELLSMEHFHAVFYDDKADVAEERPFVVAARRDEAMLTPMLPIFVFQERARRRDVEAARDSGVTDVLTMPISPKTLVTKLQVATHSPRPFIVATEFFGPDRRAKARSAYNGSDRRTRIAKKAKVDFTAI
jgi:two-component system chemotaxis response regulator CheY